MSNETSKLSISSPWIEEARKIYALFNEDPDINILYDENEKEIKLYVNGSIKADSITKILPDHKDFGNVTLKITVIPNNTEMSPIDIFRNAFNGNPICTGIVIDDSPYSLGMSHVMFENRVVQYYNDCLNDPNGLESTLFEDIARDVFVNTDGVYFNTEASDDVELWP